MKEVTATYVLLRILTEQKPNLYRISYKLWGQRTLMIYGTSALLCCTPFPFLFLWIIVALWKPPTSFSSHKVLKLLLLVKLFIKYFFQNNLALPRKLLIKLFFLNSFTSEIKVC